MNKADLAQVKEYFKLLSAVETAVGSFYEVCAAYWPEEEVWPALAVEEKRHSETVLAMLACIEAAPENFRLPAPLKGVKALTLFIEGIETNKIKVRSSAYRKLNALAVSADIEKSLIESGYEKLVETADKEYRMALEGILQDNERHEASLSGRLATLKIIK
ncbi:MAG TPA: hypothetical protein DEQ38_04090 [Elusimicrobia bacterium]|nr:MAG: hypothetical protein A2089_12840 [Elusimicrobia bacterium GWD2_63_28]HCC47283.1 hypothetical protein [Elusimicrobiota bacterium]